MHDSYQLRPLVQKPVVLVEQQLARIVHRNHAQARALFFAEHLPGHDVGVMLHRGDDDLVAGADELASIAVHHEIDSFGRAAHKDALTHVTRVDEAFHFFTRAFVGGGRFLAQVMNAAMDVRVLLFEINAAAIDDYLRHLRRGGVVEIDQRFAIDRFVARRENQHGFVAHPRSLKPQAPALKLFRYSRFKTPVLTRKDAR